MSRMKERQTVQRRGFTLVEVMVAMALTAVVALTARAMIEAVGVTGAAVSRKARERDHVMNAERHLRALAGRAIVQEAAGLRFAGSQDSVAFGTYCDVPGGWQERCSITLSIQRDSSDNALVLHVPGAPFVTLGMRSVVGFRYLLSSASEQWVERWESGSSLPLAIGIVSTHATIILRIGERG